MARKRVWQHVLAASKQEALLAVDLYNRPGEDRRLEAFVVHMQIAWLYLLHAQFRRDGVDYWYRDPQGRKFRAADGEPRSWELAHCLKAVFKQNDPVRRNVEFFIGLRDKIEHRYERVVGAVVAGKCQSLILNYEAALVEKFGAKEGLADVLRFPVFLSSLTEEAVTALKQTYTRLPKRITSYVEAFDGSLSNKIRNDYRYDFRVFLIPQTAPKSQADVAMRFVRLDELPKRQRDDLQVVETIVRDKKVPVEHLGEYRPGEVVAMVQEVASGFNMSDHTLAWKRHQVRPVAGSTKPEQTDARYCVWDRAHRDYLYTEAWVKKLIRELRQGTKRR